MLLGIEHGLLFFLFADGGKAKKRASGGEALKRVQSTEVQAVVVKLYHESDLEVKVMCFDANIAHISPAQVLIQIVFLG
jgi:hypothetical protein